VDYKEVTESDQPHLHPTYLKEGLVLLHERYERLACFDADMLIRSDTPSCFEVFSDETKLYAVRDIAENRPHVPAHLRSNFIQNVRAPFFEPLQSRLGGALDYQQYVQNFFNAGFFLCSTRRHRELFAFVQSHFPGEGDRFRGNRHYEQALFNYGAQLLAADDLAFVDESWNYIDPDVTTPLMSKHVYHFTGANYGALKRAIGDFPWRV
jgi:hypothetical protein